MSKSGAEGKPEPIKYQIYLGEELQESFERYMKEKYAPGTRVKTAVFRIALMEFMKKEGYYGLPIE